MPDREKVLKALECIKIGDGCVWLPCPYGFYGETDCRISHIIHDAIDLLKEQETTDTSESRIFHCEKCGYGIEDIYLSDEENYPIDPVYCPNCGRKVKWDA